MCATKPTTNQAAASITRLNFGVMEREYLIRRGRCPGMSAGQQAPEGLRAVGTWVDPQMVELRLQGRAFQSQAGGGAVGTAQPTMAVSQNQKDALPLLVARSNAGATFLVHRSF